MIEKQGPFIRIVEEDEDEDMVYSRETGQPLAKQNGHKKPDDAEFARLEAIVNAELEADTPKAEQRKPPKWLAERVQSLSALEKEDIPEVEFIVDGLITEGLSVFAGMLKAGKSLLALNIAVAVAAGLLALGLLQVKQGRVLYITPDDKKLVRLRRRVRNILGDKSRDIPLDIAANWPRLDEDGTDDIEAYLDYYPDTKLIVIDVLMNVLPDIRESADAYSEIYRKLEPLKKLAQDRHVAILLVMHMNKGNGKENGNPRSRIYGSMAYGAIADNILLLDENYATHVRYLMTSGKDLDEDKRELAYDKATDRYSFANKPQAEMQEVTPVVNSVLDIVRKKPGIGFNTIVSFLVTQGLKESTATQRVTRAKHSGQICNKKGENGLYPGPCEEEEDANPDY